MITNCVYCGDRQSCKDNESLGIMAVEYKNENAEDIWEVNISLLLSNVSKIVFSNSY